MLGRLEYQRGNVEAALRVFDGIDIGALASKIKISISKKAARHKSRSHWDTPPMSIHAVSLLVEALFLKARALHDLGRFKGMSKYIFNQVNRHTYAEFFFMGLIFIFIYLGEDCAICL